MARLVPGADWSNDPFGRQDRVGPMTRLVLTTRLVVTAVRRYVEHVPLAPQGPRGYVPLSPGLQGHVPLAPRGVQGRTWPPRASREYVPLSPRPPGARTPGPRGVQGVRTLVPQTSRGTYPWPPGASRGHVPLPPRASRGTYPWLQGYVPLAPRGSPEAPLDALGGQWCVSCTLGWDWELGEPRVHRRLGSQARHWTGGPGRRVGLRRHLGEA